jgi:hypothetical protein
MLHEDILGLEVSVIDAYGMAKLNSVKYLQESSFSQRIIPYEVALFHDAGEQVTFPEELRHNIDSFTSIKDADY